jgi:hypothetical protein
MLYALCLLHIRCLDLLLWILVAMQSKDPETQVVCESYSGCGCLSVLSCETIQLSGSPSEES